MVPKGNMMHCMLREVDGAVKQLKYSITGKEIPVEIMEIETELSQFFEGEIKNIKREGGSGHSVYIFSSIIFFQEKNSALWLVRRSWCSVLTRIRSDHLLLLI